MYGVLSGAIMMGCLTTTLFFFKFWRKTYDRFFLIFALAFMFMGLERLVLGFLGANSEQSINVYLLRLVAFLFILAAIVDKNRQAKKSN